MSNKIDVLNKSLRKLAKEEEILIVDNSNIDTACLRYAILLMILQFTHVTHP